MIKIDRSFQKVRNTFFEFRKMIISGFVTKVKTKIVGEFTSVNCFVTGEKTHKLKLGILSKTEIDALVIGIQTFEIGKYFL